MKHDENFKVRNEEIETVLKDLGHLIGGALPPGWAFNLVIASIGERGNTFYISNMQREDSLNLLQELINKNKKEGKI